MFVGIDVAKAELVISILPSAERFTVDNDERGVRTLVERLRVLAPALIVLEATGGYELLSVAALAAATLPVRVSAADGCGQEVFARARWLHRQRLQE
jgi:transposase